MEKKKAASHNLQSKRYVPLLLAMLFALGLHIIPTKIQLSLPTSDQISAGVFPAPHHTLPPQTPWQIDLGVGLVQATGGLTITKVGQPAMAVDVGSLITYTLAITNHTGVDLEEVLITDTIPEDTQCNTLSQPTNWVTNASNCDQGSLALWFSDNETFAHNDVLLVTLTAQVDSPLADQTIIHNQNYAVEAKAVGSGTPYTDVGTESVDTIVNAPTWAISKKAQPHDVVNALSLIHI